MTASLTIEAVCEAQPGPKWKSRWDWSWPAYEAWFLGRGCANVPEQQECEAALAHYMPELVPTYRRLRRFSGGGERAARFLSGWCPPAYLGGCSIAAQTDGRDIRLVRNYDLSPDLNEGFLLRSEWTGRAVMGMVEFLWGLSDGINDAGLSVALAFGGRGTTAPGFGITHIVRYILETCDTVAAAVRTLRRVPSHMAYNLVLADASGRLASVEMQPGGGIRLLPQPLATNHQHGPELVDRAAFTRTYERRSHLEELLATRVHPAELRRHFLEKPLFQDNYRAGFGTLFTIDYDPAERKMSLLWPQDEWHQAIDRFEEGSRTVHYVDESDPVLDPGPWAGDVLRDTDWYSDRVDWVQFGWRIAEACSAGDSACREWDRVFHAAFDEARRP